MNVSIVDPAKTGNTTGHGQNNVCGLGTEVIRDLQKHFGHDPCFRTAKLLACTRDCQWRRHCRKPVAEWRRES